ncbi:unnamed protein product [Gemmata massiliana]|uniref:Uncharacterized protein n=1 Tax=Gemmata massiliana TaxID=1210884 RepID=A0A6P2CX71_9BACT|nr:unnamed protein product [Gemmata massiliana]
MPDKDAIVICRFDQKKKPRKYPGAFVVVNQTRSLSHPLVSGSRPIQPLVTVNEFGLSRSFGTLFP